MVGSGRSLKAPTILQYIRPGLFCTRQVLQNKQIAILKDAMKDPQLVENFCYFKNGV